MGSAVLPCLKEQHHLKCRPVWSNHINVSFQIRRTTPDGILKGLLDLQTYKGFKMKKYIFLLLLLTACTNVPSTLNLRQKADTIITAVEQDPPDKKTVKTTAVTLYDDDKTVSKMQQELIYYKTQVESDYVIKSSYYYGASAFLLVIGIVLLTYNMPKLGIGLILASGGLTAYVALISTYQWLIGLVAAILILGTMIYVTWKAWKGRFHTLDLVKTTEIFKERYPDEWNNVKSIVEKLQHPSTKKEVYQIKQREIKR